MISACESAPSEEIEDALFKLAEGDSRFYDNHAWRNAVLRQGTLSAALRFVDMVAKGTLDTKGPDSWHMTQQVAALLDEHAELRAHVYAVLKEGTDRGSLTANQPETVDEWLRRSSRTNPRETNYIALVSGLLLVYPDAISNRGAEPAGR